MGVRRVGRGASLPQCLVLSSTGTTSLEQNRISAGWAWCFAPRNALFFRRRAPRLLDKMGLRPVGRGASLPAMPCSFVDGHHVFWTKWGFGRLGVVLRSPQCLVLSSPGTTSSEQNRIRPVERGASLPATPCSFVAGHHVFGTKWGFGRLGVVLRSPQHLVLPSTGTTSLEQNRIRPVGRGASLPPMPCSFVAGHHVFGTKSDSAG